MTGVLCVIDGDCDWEQRVAATQLAARLPSERLRFTATCFGDLPGSPWLNFPGESIRTLASSGTPAMLRAPKLQRLAESIDARIVLTWGMGGLAAAGALPRDRCVIHSVFDPGISDQHVKLLRTVAERVTLAVACSAERVRRRLVERGVPFERCVVVRPAVDFAEISRVNRDEVRRSLDVPEDARLFVIPPPCAASDGHVAVLWAVTMRRYLDESVRLVVPGTRPEVQRIRHYASVSGRSDTVIYSGNRLPFEQLCVAADDLVIGDLTEIPMTAAAWAMAGNTLITAPATYATTEMLANDLNARLFKGPEGWRNRAAKLAAVLDPTDQRPRITEVARGQAYEVFSLRRFARQFEQVIDNLLAEKPPGKGISDPALVDAA